MLVTLGAKRPAEGLEGLLLECHERIRSFIDVAGEVGRRLDLPDDDVKDACTRCARYFAEALPLHVQDEELSLLPRLEGKSAELDLTLQRMHEQHQAHEPQLEELLNVLGNVRERPRDSRERQRLRAVAERLARELEEHLQLEEKAIIPFLSELSSDMEAKIIHELRARRGA